MYIEDTIAAIATPPGIGGVGIIRISGKDALSTVENIFRGQSTVPLVERPNRTINYGHIVENDKIVDEVLLLIMRKPHSYTAEDVVEIQCHGGIVPVRKIMNMLLARGIRLAEPGEFTQRAFLNGRIDLTQAEAIIDVIEAKSEESLNLAINQLDGKLSKFIGSLREALITIIARLEVTIDYPEEDIEELTTAEVKKEVVKLNAEMTKLLETANSGRLIRDGIATAIIGLPNAGKSSLMNSLLRENRAIVTDIPGTTRDSIEEYMNVDGITIRLIDTAGIRETEDVVEKIGVEKARDYMAKADLVLVVLDGSTKLNAEEILLLEAASTKNAVVFINKKDLELNISKEEVARYGNFAGIEHISANEDDCNLIFKNYVQELVYKGNVKQSDQTMLSNIRHIDLMKKAKNQCETALENIDSGLPIEFIATDLREGWEFLGEITGDSLRDDISKELFSRFCLGK